MDIPKMTNCRVYIQMRKSMAICILKENPSKKEPECRTNNSKGLTRYAPITPPLSYCISSDGVILGVLQTKEL